MGKVPVVGAGRAALDVDFEQARNRFATVIQPLAGVPQYLVVSLATVPLITIVVYVWLSLLITTRWPERPFRLIICWLRCAISIWAYLTLVVGTYPGWTLELATTYPVRLTVGPRKRRYSRTKTLFRLVYALPSWVGAALGGILLCVLAVLSWVVIIGTGKQDERLFHLQRIGLAWFTQYGLIINLVIEDYDWDLTGSSVVPAGSECGPK
jgi:hypothetical protein